MSNSAQTDTATAGHPWPFGRTGYTNESLFRPVRTDSGESMWMTSSRGRSLAYLDGLIGERGGRAEETFKGHRRQISSGKNEKGSCKVWVHRRHLDPTGSHPSTGAISTHRIAVPTANTESHTRWIGAVGYIPGADWS